MYRNWIRTSLTVFTLAAAGVVAACADQEAVTPLAPVATAEATQPDPLLGFVLRTVVKTLRMEGVKRHGALPRDIRVSAKIGSAGGTIRIPEAGLTVTFARGAVAKTTTISVTAKRGNAIAYEFAPHGLVFAAPVTIHQDFKNTGAGRAAAAAAVGGYYPNPASLDLVNASAEVSELRPTSFDGTRISFPIEHFSGYILTSGRAMR